jgi:hypothetical protein
MNHVILGTCKDNILIHDFTSSTTFSTPNSFNARNKIQFHDSAKMESRCGFAFHRLHRDSNQSQQTLECGHHPMS